MWETPIQEHTNTEEHNFNIRYESLSKKNIRYESFVLFSDGCWCSFSNTFEKKKKARKHWSYGGWKSKGLFFFLLKTSIFYCIRKFCMCNLRNFVFFNLSTSSIFVFDIGSIWVLSKMVYFCFNCWIFEDSSCGVWCHYCCLFNLVWFCFYFSDFWKV